MVPAPPRQTAVCLGTLDLLTELVRKPVKRGDHAHAAASTGSTSGERRRQLLLLLLFLFVLVIVFMITIV